MTDESDSSDGSGDAPSTSPEELHERIRRGDAVRLLDVRNRDEYEAWRITGGSVDATQVPYAQFAAAKARGDLSEFVADLGIDPDEPVVAVCPRGEASATVADYLRDEGVEARNLAGGMRGWARVYAATELPASAVPDDAAVVQYDRPATGCLSYLLVSGDEAAVVDPLRAFTDRYVADAAERGADLRYAVDTHVHADHLSGVRRLAGESGGDEPGPSSDRPAAGDVEAVLPAGATDRGLAFDARLLDDGDELRVGDVGLTALHAPGHTTELTALRLGDLLFSGDALFVDSFGRPDLERGDEGAGDLAGALYDTLRDRLLALPDDTLVAPGHRTPDAEPNSDEGDAYAARIGTIRERLRIPDEKEAFVDRVLDSLPPRPANYEDIVPANLGRESPDDETAFEMELGPNNCAVAADD